jgi:hypothetical protein
MNKRVFLNSMPKSGTFLLAKTLQLLGYKDFSKDIAFFKKGLSKLGMWVPLSFSHEQIDKNLSYRFFRVLKAHSYVDIGVMSPIKVPSSLCSKWLEKVPEGYFIAGHVPCTETFEGLLKELNFRHIIIIRDPRDVLVSMAHYIAKPVHPLSKTMSKFSFNKRIQFLMKGGMVGNRIILNFKDAYSSMLKWRYSRDCVLIRFEELIGEKGGGNKSSALMTLKNIAGYLDINLDDSRMNYIYSNIFDVNSPTFRKGKIGSWKEEFPAGLLDNFNEQMKEIITELGYEI